MRATWLLAITLAAVGCGTDITLGKQSVCDGLLSGGENTVDDAFDRDGDGAFDGANPDCLAVYSAASLDCDDANPDIRPGRRRAQLRRRRQ